MSWIGRFSNLFRRGRLNDEIEEELGSHIEEAIERGRSAEEALKAFGGRLRYRELSRDMKLLPWVDALASDVTFGWRQLNKHRVVSAAAILSLALAIGATTAAFRLADAVLLRKLPVAEPERLFFLAVTEVNRDGRPDYRDDFDYPTFRKHSEMLGDRADLMVIGMAAQQDATFSSDDQRETVYRQYVSGNVFGVLGLNPAAGRLLTPDDDKTPGGRPVAVLSYAYWNSRFGRDPKAIGKTFQLGGKIYEVIGVAPKDFTGTEPGLVTDIFIPATMNTRALDSPGWSWFRIWVRPKPGVSPEQVLQPLQAALTLAIRERLKMLDSDAAKRAIDPYPNRPLLLPAASGTSGMQKEYRRPLFVLAILVALVLLIACANVGNLLTAQAAARAREMALRVAIGAGQWRLIQLVMVESALLAAIASAVGALFSWWSAPLVVSMLAPADHPVRLVLDAGWRALEFGFALTVTVTLLFGLAPALQASAVKPSSALKGAKDPHSRRGLMNSLVTLQVAFSVLVLFVAGLFVSTFERLSHRPLGFSPQRVVVLETEVPGKSPPSWAWTQVAGQIQQTPGVESVAFAGWAPLTDNRWTGSVRIPGRAAEPRVNYFLDVSPGFFTTMRIGLIDGREFRPGDSQPKLTGDNQPSAGVGIVNEAFARAYFDSQNPVGKTVGVHEGKNLFAAMEIVGYVRDACYGSVREPIRPTVYVPIERKGGSAFIVRTSGDPQALATTLRRVISQARSEFRVRGVDTENALVLRHMIRERLLATVSFFFAIVALVLAGVGLYGVLNYSVIQQRREIGIRMTLGASPGQIVRQVTSGMLGMVCLGLAGGLAGGVACERFVESLLFEVQATNPRMMVAPLLTLLGATLLAALPPAIRAVKIDPAQTLRSE
jgi:putative ABC transport system permease protein